MQCCQTVQIFVGVLGPCPTTGLKKKLSRVVQNFAHFVTLSITYIRMMQGRRTSHVRTCTCKLYNEDTHFDSLFPGAQRHSTYYSLNYVKPCPTNHADVNQKVVYVFVRVCVCARVCVVGVCVCCRSTRSTLLKVWCDVTMSVGAALTKIN